MALIKTPICNFGEKAKNFKLKSIEGENLSLEDVKLLIKNSFKSSFLDEKTKNNWLNKI